MRELLSSYTKQGPCIPTRHGISVSSASELRTRLVRHIKIDHPAKKLRRNKRISKVQHVKFEADHSDEVSDSSADDVECLKEPTASKAPKAPKAPKPSISSIKTTTSAHSPVHSVSRRRLNTPDVRCVRYKGLVGEPYGEQTSLGIIEGDGGL